MKSMVSLSQMQIDDVCEDMEHGLPLGTHTAARESELEEDESD